MTASDPSETLGSLERRHPELAKQTFNPPQASLATACAALKLGDSIYRNQLG